ncbi:MAG: hypothetical protein HW411_1351, partial [Gammaproteobacteria bacterium]|nr:hypothetical protein [Gammaproteobacteria bacterium]
IEPLLQLNPDYLGFRGALCRKQQRQQAIDVMAVHRIRAMIPATAAPFYGDRKIMVSAN